MPRDGSAVAARGGGTPANGQAPAGQQQPQANPLMSIIRMVMFWYFISNFFSKKAKPDTSTRMMNVLQRGEELDMSVYLSEEEVFNKFSDESALIWSESNIPYGSYEPKAKRSSLYTYHPSEAVQNNGSLYAHMFFSRTGYSPDPADPTYDLASTFSKSHPLIVYHKKPKVDTRKNLLKASGGESNSTNNQVLEKEKEEKDAAGAVAEEVEWTSYFKPNLTIVLVDDFTMYVRGKVPDVFVPHMQYDYNSGNYFPMMAATDFWLLKDKLIPMNSTVSEVSISLTVETLSLWKWQLYLGMEQSFKIQQKYGTALESESDEIKRVFLEGNPILLGVTMVVSLLHSVFDFLAFKNDIQFWNQNKSMEGLSARSIVINFVCQLIVVFYLLDNETSWMIIISSIISCAIEFWKIGKAMHIEVDRSGRIPMLRFRHRDSYTNNKTKEYDEQATRYLSYALYPLVFGYAVYSLMYDTHKSWYSWVLSSLTGCVYTFGFIMMCPQLFINYKLKSVAHLPWRQMTYKFLNTIVDDLFAFVIKMPTLHRLSVFRDDVIFLIYVYQRWIYPVDKKRVNEFGFGGEEAKSPEKKTKLIEEKKEEKTEDVGAKEGVGLTFRGSKNTEGTPKVEETAEGESSGGKKNL